MLKHLAVAVVGFLIMNGETNAVERHEARPLIIKASDEQNSKSLRRDAGQGLRTDKRAAMTPETEEILRRARARRDADRSLFRKAAEQGDINAQVSLGQMYLVGRGGPRNDVKAAHWYGKAAEQGHAEAQVIIGLLYEEGQGVPQDYLEAARWYQKASEQKHARALRQLGQMYKHGRGVSQDEILAHVYFNLSGSFGDNVARTSRETIAARMTRDQIAEAQRLAREWLAIRQ